MQRQQASTLSILFPGANSLPGRENASLILSYMISHIGSRWQLVGRGIRSFFKQRQPLPLLDGHSVSWTILSETMKVADESRTWIKVGLRVLNGLAFIRFPSFILSPLLTLGVPVDESGLTLISIKSISIEFWRKANAKSLRCYWPMSGYLIRFICGLSTPPTVDPIINSALMTLS